MASSRFGELLRSQREAAGMGLDHVSSVTRIRRKFLEAFERGDFAEMPPSGYARGMIVSYAKLLGIQPDEILALFDEELKDYELKLLRQQDSEMPGFPARYGASGSTRASGQRYTRPVTSYPTQHYSSNYDQERVRSQRGSSSRSTTQTRSGSNASRHPQAASLDQHGGGAYRYAEQGSASYNHFKDKPQSKRHVIIGLIGVAAIIIIGLLAWAIFSPNKDNTPVLPHLAANDSTEQKDTVLDPSIQSGGIDLSTGANEPFTIDVRIPEGNTSNLSITVDGHEAFSGNAIGPFEQSYDVTQSIQMTISNPDAVQLTYNGKTIMPTVSNGVGTIDIKVKS